MITDNLKPQIATSKGEIMTELKPCPFCGKTETLTVTHCIEAECCKHYEKCYESSRPWLAVVCDARTGGCGSGSGFAPTEKEAIEKWNARR